MAFVNDIRSIEIGIADRVRALAAQIRAALARRRIYLRTLEELRRLDNRELADLGIHPSELGRVAREAVDRA